MNKDAASKIAALLNQVGEVLRFRRLAFAMVSFVIMIGAMAIAAHSTERSGLFSINLLSSKSVYHRHEPIYLAFYVRNNASTAMMMTNWVPWGIIRLEVLDDRGKIMQTPGVLGYRREITDGRIYTPGENHLIRYLDPFNNTLMSWTPIEYFGYDLPTGTYRITATLKIAGRPPTASIAQWFETNDRSNTITITVDDRATPQSHRSVR